ncbi:DUF3465 domain-containing protein [Leucothrix sargassi]|nr:DUF3465 domain-containing protein [Leucothrix sargassi]
MNKFSRILAGIAVAAVVGGYNYLFNDGSNSSQSNNNQSPSNLASGDGPNIENQAALLSKIRSAKEDTNSRFWMSTEATVIKNLKDDTKGSQHQKFLIRLASDVTLLVAHNIDLSPRAPVSEGDRIKIRGRYEWNNRGGVLHWTHHDPKGKIEGGWIYANNKYYK